MRSAADLRTPQRGAGRHKRPVCVVGHPLAPIGMGEHARSVWRALGEVSEDVGVVDIYHGHGCPDDPVYGPTFSTVTEDYLSDGVNIFCINGDEVQGAVAALKDRNLFAAGSRNVIYPAWELERYPEEWARELNRFDEVWAPSGFIRDALTRAVEVPVVHMPLACEMSGRALVSRQHFGIRESAYAFLFAFDFLSFVERKNPFAVLEAFGRLLQARPMSDVTLVVKCNNGDRRPDMKARFDEAISGFRDRVLVVDRTLTDPEMKALFWLSDCFVSLHRSEGFGRGLSEAMALGKPVIATAYSGNLDFCDEETAFLTPFALVPVLEGQYPHWRDQHWADADVAAAAAYMIALVDQPETGRQKGVRGRRKIAADFSYLAAGVRYGERMRAGLGRDAA